MELVRSDDRRRGVGPTLQKQSTLALSAFQIGLAGAVYGGAAIPERWSGAVHVPLPGFGGRVLRAGELGELARRQGENTSVADNLSAAETE